MTRTLSASVLALAVAFSALSVAPAQAGKNDLGRFLVGAAALVAISKVIENNKKRARQPAISTKRPPHYHAPKAPVHVPHPPAAPIYQSPVYAPPIYAPYQPLTFRGFLPSECFFDVRRADKSRGVYSKLCLGELMARAENLPEVCEDRVTTSNGRRTQVFDAKCLVANGYADEAGQYN